MENKKDIGKAFREKIDSLQKQPDNAVWDAINANLPKKKRRLLPLFWVMASTITKTMVVIVSFLIIVATYFFITRNTEQNKNLTTTSTTKPDSTFSTKQSNKNALTPTAKNTHESEIHKQRKSDGSTVNNQVLTTKPSTNSITQHKVLTPKDSRAVSVNNTRSVSASNKEERLSNRGNNNNAVFSSKSFRNKNSGIAYNNQIEKKDHKKLKNRSAVNILTPIETNNNHDLNTTPSYSTTVSTADSLTVNRESDVALTALNNSDLDSTALDSISNKSSVDSTAICKDIVYENSLKNDSVTLGNSKKFYTLAYAAPTVYNTNNALLPDTSLAGNATSTKVSLNYGAFLGYNFNSEWSIRAGIAITRLQHTTQNALLKSTYSVVPGTPVTNPNGYVHLIQPENYTEIYYTRNGSNAAALKQLSTGTNEAMVDIIQKTEFAEVPVQITHTIYNSDFKAGIATGISAVFTTKNIVYAQNENGTMWLGYNKNVKDVGFSGSVGIPLQYQLMPQVNINAEPVFSYYFSSFRENKPYSFGFQIGLQYNFNFFQEKTK